MGFVTNDKPYSVGNAYATANAVTPRKIWITSASNAPTGLLLTQSACIIDHHTPRRKQVGGCVGLITPDFFLPQFSRILRFGENCESYIAFSEKSKITSFGSRKCEDERKRSPSLFPPYII